MSKIPNILGYPQIPFHRLLAVGMKGKRLGEENLGAIPDVILQQNIYYLSLYLTFHRNSE